MRERFKNSLILDILPIIFIIVFGEISILQWRTGVVPPILAGVVVSGTIAFMRGETLRNIEDAMGSGVKRVFPALLTVILVGLIVSSWIIGGIIPSMVYWGFKVIDFRFFVPIVMAMTGAVAIITGTSFTSIGTIGVSFIIIAKQVGIPLEITAGAIVSGAFLGDKMSPLSDTTNISAALGKTDLFEQSLPGLGRFADYFTTVSHSRMRMVATWARVALPWGTRVPFSIPAIRPWPTAQFMAGIA